MPDPHTRGLTITFLLFCLPVHHFSKRFAIWTYWLGALLRCLGWLPPPYPQLFFWLHYKWDVEKQSSDWRQLPLFSLGFGMSVCVGACASPAAVYMSYVRKGSDAPRAAEVHASLQQKKQCAWLMEGISCSHAVPWHANASASRKQFFVCLGKVGHLAILPLLCLTCPRYQPRQEICRHCPLHTTVQSWGARAWTCQRCRRLPTFEVVLCRIAWHIAFRSSKVLLFLPFLHTSKCPSKN